MRKHLAKILIFFTTAIMAITLIPSVFASEGNVTVNFSAVFDDTNLLADELELPLGGSISFDFDDGALEDYVFAFWIVNGTVNHQFAASHVFLASDGLALVAVFYPITESAFPVIFIDSNGHLIGDPQYVLATEAVTEPSVVGYSKPGYEMYTAETTVVWDTLTGSENLENITAPTVYRLQYQLLAHEGYTLTLSGGTATTLTPNYNEIVTVTATLENFTHWVDENETVVSYAASYSYSALSDRTLVARTGGTPEPVLYLINVTGIRTSYDSFIAQVYLPADYQTVSFGFSVGEDTRVSHAIHPNTKEFLLSIPEELLGLVSAYAHIKSPTDQVITLNTALTEMSTIELTSEFHTYFATGHASDFTEFFVINDPIDGEVTVTEAMLTSNADMDSAGNYTIQVNFRNSLGYRTAFEHNISVLDALSVTEAIDAANNTEMLVYGVVVGYGQNMTPILIEDSINGNAIEIWGNNNSYNDIEVGDEILVYSSNKTLEKGQPRLGGTHRLARVLSSENDLHVAETLTDLSAWADEKALDPTDIYGRYTFDATLIHKTGTYAFFTRWNTNFGDETRFIQFAIHSSSVAGFDTVTLGKNYTITAVLYGLSDDLDVLQTENNTTAPTLRMGIMSEDDIIENNVPISVTDAVSITTVDTPILVQGVVVGYGVDGANKRATIIEDSLTGIAIEIWNIGNTHNVGDLIIVSGTRVNEKGLPRIGNSSGNPVLVEIVSTGNALTAPKEITDLRTWADDVMAATFTFYGRVTFTAEMIDAAGGNYKYFTRRVGDEPRFIQFSYSNTSSFYKYTTFTNGTTYSVTGVIIGISDAISNIPGGPASPSLRLGLMGAQDVIVEA